MNPTAKRPDVQMIAVDQIEVLNPRERNQKSFEKISENIANIGIKKPVTVTPRFGPDGSKRYLLICGEGRLQTFRKYGETHIPSLVVDVTDEQAYLMSLTENIARRAYRPLERLSGVTQLHIQGYGHAVIAEKTGLSLEYVESILALIQQGETRLLTAVVQGRIPLSAAFAIIGSGNDDIAMQTALQEAYEGGKLRGAQLVEARRLVERRRRLGPAMGRGSSSAFPKVTSTSLVRVYQKEVVRQRLLVRKQNIAQKRLLFVAGALRRLLADENFVNLLRAERLDTMPKYLADRVAIAGSPS